MPKKSFFGISLLAVALFISTAATSTAKAQAFADQVPEEAFIYVAWQGTEGLKAQYEASNLKKAADAFAVDQLEASIMSMMDMGLQMAPGAPDKQAIGMAETLAKTFWKYPSAVAVTLDISQIKAKGDEPDVMINLFCNAGPEAQQLSGILSGLAPMVQANTFGQMSASVANNGGTVAMTFKSKNANPANLSGAKLANNATFKAELAKGINNPAMAVYVDAEGVIKRLQEGMTKAGVNSELQQMNMVLEATGLGGIKAVAMTAGYKGANWTQHTTAHIPSPRKGLMKLIDQPKLNIADLQAIPEKASWLYAISLDPKQVFDAVMGVMQMMEPQQAQEIKTGIESMKMMQIDAEKELIGSLGSTWMMFSDLGLTGKPIQMSNVWLVNKAKNAANLEGLINKIWPMAAMQMGQDPTMQAVATQVAGVNVKKITAQGMSFFLFVHKGHMVISFGNDSAEKVINQINGVGTSLANAASFKAVAGRMGQMHITGVHYADLKAFWTSVDPLLRMGVGLGQMQLMGMNPNYKAYVMPPMEQLLTPFSIAAVEMTYVDNQGVHSRAIEPFPGASLISPRGIISIAPAAIAGFVSQRNTAMKMEAEAFPAP